VKVADLGLVKTPGAVDEPSAPETPKADDPAKKPRSKLAESAATNVTRAGLAMGTPAYMSPEQAAGKADLDARSDLYSLGCVAYYLLAGHPPFVRDTAVRTLAAHLDEPPAPLTSRWPEVSADLQEVVLRCLAKEPTQRFQSADDLDQALGQCHCANAWTRELAAAWWHTHATEDQQGAAEAPPPFGLH
jgi:serine/threonine-protein kinase